MSKLHLNDTKYLWKNDFRKLGATVSSRVEGAVKRETDVSTLMALLYGFTDVMRSREMESSEAVETIDLD